MGRTGSTLRARLSMLINFLIELETKEGVISTRELAEKASLTDRAMRDYMDILTSMNILEYVGAGKYRLNKTALQQAYLTSLMEPRLQYTLEDFMDAQQLVKISKAVPLEKKVKSIIERMNLEYLISDKLRNTLREIIIDDDLRMEGLIGDKLILEKAAKDINLHEVWFGGSSGAYNIKNYRYLSWAVFTIVYLSAGGYLGYYQYNTLNQEKSRLLQKPDLEAYRGKDPFFPEDPFYEMSTDFPELLIAGRNIAARYLIELMHYSLDHEIISNHSDKINLLIHQGTILPHGFIVQSRALLELRDRVNKTFLRTMKEAQGKGILVVGVSVNPHDNRLIRILGKVKKLKIGETSDLNLMVGVLRDGDATCLIRRPTERGRIPVDNWYEFYLRKGDFVMKFEFLSDNPLDDQKRILDILYSLSVPPPVPGIIPGPGVVQAAEQIALRNLEYLNRTVTMTLKAGLQEFLAQKQIKSDMDMAKKLRRDDNKNE